MFWFYKKKKYFCITKTNIINQPLIQFNDEKEHLICFLDAGLGGYGG